MATTTDQLNQAMDLVFKLKRENEFLKDIIAKLEIRLEGDKKEIAELNELLHDAWDTVSKLDGTELYDDIDD